jgi:oligosaccharide repeat unit polymerase
VISVNGKLAALLFSTIILAQAYLVRRFVGTWLFPACLLGLFWFLLTFIPLVALFSVPIDPYAVGFICFCLLAFSVSLLFFPWKIAFKRNAEKKEDTPIVYGSRLLKSVFNASFVLSISMIFVHLYEQGFSLADLVFNFFLTVHSYRDLSTFNELNALFIERWSLVFAYLGAMIGGLRFGSITSKSGRRWLIVLSFLPGVLIALTQSSKWQLFLCMAFFYGGVLAYRVSNGKAVLVDKIKMKSIVLAAVLLISIVSVSFMARGLYDLDDDDSVVDHMMLYFRSYSCVHIYAFADWFSFTNGGKSQIVYNNGKTGYGFYTFTTLFRLLGSQRTLPPGAFDDYYSYGEVLTGNLYTMFRGLIADFGFVGSLAFMFGLGLVFHGAFYALLCQKRPMLPVAVFVLMVGVFYSSFIFSLLGSDIVYYVAFAMLWAILHLNRRRLVPKVGAGTV